MACSSISASTRSPTLVKRATPCRLAGIGPLKQIRVQTRGMGMPDEGCVVADMILLGILLSDGGTGDYWDDVDRYVRNQLAERQFLRRDLMEQMVALGPEHKIRPPKETGDHVIASGRLAGVAGNRPRPSDSLLSQPPLIANLERLLPGRAAGRARKVRATAEQQVPPMVRKRAQSC